MYTNTKRIARQEFASIYMHTYHQRGGASIAILLLVFHSCRAFTSPKPGSRAGHTTHRIEDARQETGTATQSQDRRIFVCVLAEIDRQCTPTMLTCKAL